jgi:hypothetical protein
MTKAYYNQILGFILIGISVLSCKTEAKKPVYNLETNTVWEVDFLDDFDTFNQDNWQDQRIGLITKRIVMSPIMNSEHEK